MLAQFRNIRTFVVLLIDIVVFVISFAGAYELRFDFSLQPSYFVPIAGLLLLFIPCKLLIFFVFGLYKGMWRYTSVNDLWRLGQACVLSTLSFLLINLLGVALPGVPRSVFALDGLLTFIMSGGLRVGIRLYYTMANTSERLQIWRFSTRRRKGLERKSLLIIGAGSAGEKILREIQGNQRLNYNVLGFLDDDRSKWGRSLHGVKIYGAIDMIPEIVERENVDEALIAIPSATGPQIRRITEICKSCELDYRTLPEIGAIIDGKVSIKSLRDLKYEDLLRRPPVRLNTMEINRYLRGKKVLVTGAGGSIGSELCRQLIRFEPEELILVDASEVQLFGIQMELQHEIDFLRYQCILSQVQDQELMDKVFRQYGPQLIFHAAAYKHVPLLEKNPWEAIFNNVLGSRVVMDLALKYGVERFVLVSTDKAVRPTNVMGASKRLAELILQSLQGRGTLFMAVRFGNVIGSSGSVLPLFRRQLEQGGPITVTHREVTRYFMTIPEAAQLILQAGSLGTGGEIFILEMGTPVKIAEMAEELVRLSGKEPGKDVEIIFTGLREGEKLYEELITQGEGIVNTKHEKILALCNQGWNGKQNQAEFVQWLYHSLEDLYRIAATHDAQAIKDKLHEVIPEYAPQQNVKCVLQPDGVILKKQTA